MTEIFRPPYLQVETSAGVPVSGAKLNFYQAGTTTKVDIFQDSGLGTPHANPVVADASGRFAAIYLDEGSDYKVVLTDADDVTLQTFDDINPVTSSDEVSDNVFRVTDNLDATKKLAFQVSGLTTGTTRTLTVPDESGTILTSAALATTTEQLTGTSATKASSPNSIAALWEKGADVASAATVTLGDGGFFHITGSTGPITDIDFTTSKDGRMAWLEFDSTPTITHNATTLDLPGDADITAVAGDRMLVVQDSSDNIHVLAYVRAALSPDRITLGTVTASTSGTAIDFTGIPAGTKRITIHFQGVSLSGSANLLVQLGDAGGVETSGYLGAATRLANSGSVIANNFTAGFGVYTSSATHVMHGSITLDLLDASAFAWVAAGVLGHSDQASMSTTAGSKALSAELDQVRITTSNGSDTFDAGNINISYEG